MGTPRASVSLLIIYGIAAGGRSLFEAKVVGDTVGLHPLATLIAMYTGALLWGVNGSSSDRRPLSVGQSRRQTWRPSKRLIGCARLPGGAPYKKGVGHGMVDDQKDE